MIQQLSMLHRTVPYAKAAKEQHRDLTLGMTALYVVTCTSAVIKYRRSPPEQDRPQGRRCLSAAAAQQDRTLHHRIFAHTDIVEYDAKCHRSSFSHSISGRNITLAQSKATGALEESCYDKAVGVVVTNLQKNS